MQARVDTLIIGGGMAGMFCALRLREAGLPYLMITERLGGRVMYKPEYGMNFGAVLYFANDYNIKRILTPGPLALARPLRMQLHRGDVHYPLLSFRVLRQLPGLLKYRRYLKTFIAHYNAYKKHCETMPVKEALALDPFLHRLFNMPSAQLLAELGVSEACYEITSFFAFTCTGVPVKTLSAFDYCCLSQGIVHMLRFFSFSETDMHKQLASQRGAVAFDTVMAMTKDSGGYRVTTAKSFTVEARNVVLATSADAARAFIDLPQIRHGTRMFTYLLKGIPQATYRDKDIHLFSDVCEVLYLAKRDGTADEYEMFSNTALDLGKYFIEHKLICMQEWPQAIYTHPSLLLDQDRGDNLYLTGDQHGIGMESAAISGIFAANRIIDKAAAA